MEATIKYVRGISKRKEVPIFIALLVLCIVISFLSPFFLTWQNIFNVFRQFSVIAILAVGQGLIIITGGIDLSVGALLGLMGVLAASLAAMGVPAVLVFPITILFGCMAGSVTGLLITKVRINPFIVTLGMMSVARGVSLLITGGMPISIDNGITYLGGGHIGNVPVSVIIMFVVAICGYVFTTRTLPGRNIFAIGNNERAARLSGIQTDKMKIMVYVIMGALCALSGMIVSGTLNTAEPAAGTGYELDVIAAVVIGGASLSGGKGSIIGIVMGAAIMGVLRNGFVLLQVSAYWQVVTIGLVIIGAVAIDSIKNRSSNA
ncbi:ABC transporter permease [Cohnella mopanensis]|uniref:ABC transporter permease n=1 Tax=Cohnella mopanensis TaxID=2911966 RepID=UPI001EF83D13|nr:ABC transporter permease [Cohnella mopanensis]